MRAYVYCCVVGVAIDWQQVYVQDNGTTLSGKGCSMFKLQGYTLHTGQPNNSSNHVFRNTIHRDNYTDSEGNGISYRLLPLEDNTCNTINETYYYRFTGMFICTTTVSLGQPKMVVALLGRPLVNLKSQLRISILEL